MDLLQTWLIVGVPGLIFLGALFAGHSQLRAMAGYVVLAALVVVFLTVPENSAPGDVISAAAVGLVGFFLVATGRGTAAVDELPEHQETRRRFTVARHGE